MQVNNDYIGLLLDIGQDIINCVERAVSIGLHKDPALEINNGNLDVLINFEWEDPVSVAGGFRRVISRPEQGSGIVDIVNHVLLFPDMVARSQDIESAGQEFVGDFGGDAGAAGRVLGIGNAEMELFPLL